MKLFQGFSGNRHVPQVIDIRENDRLNRWCRDFGVTRHQLTRAVSTVGGNPDLVRRHLRYRNPI